MAVLALPACGNDDGDETIAKEPATPEQIYDAWSRRTETIGFSKSIEHLADALPATATARGRELEGVVVGRVVSAEPGGAFAMREVPAGEEEAPDGQLVGWDDDKVAWRDATVTVEVEHLWSTRLPEDATTIRLKVPLAGDVPPESFVAGLARLGRIVAVLAATIREPPGPGRHSVLWEATALGHVTDSGGLSFPAMSDDEAATFLGRITTLEELEKAATPGG